MSGAGNGPVIFLSKSTPGWWGAGDRTRFVSDSKPQATRALRLLSSMIAIGYVSVRFRLTPFASVWFRRLVAPYWHPLLVARDAGTSSRVFLQLVVARNLIWRHRQ